MLQVHEWEVLLTATYYNSYIDFSVHCTMCELHASFHEMHDEGFSFLTTSLGKKHILFYVSFSKLLSSEVVKKENLAFIISSPEEQLRNLYILHSICAQLVYM